MICNRYHPSQHLSHVIAYFWTLQSKNSGDHSNIYRLVPDGYVDWVFHLKEPWAFSQSRKSKSKKRFQSHLFGHTKDYIDLILPQGPLFVFGVKFHPWAAHHIWQVNMHEVTDIEVSLTDLNINHLSFLEEQIQEATPIFDKIKRVEAFLEKKCGAGFPSDLQPMVRQILQNKANNHRLLPISQRRLQQRFLTEVGIPQKLLQRISRINRLIRIMIQTPKPHFTSLAYQFDYFDQSHLIRDFQKFTGLSPSKFLKSIDPSEDFFNLKIN